LIVYYDHFEIGGRLLEIDGVRILSSDQKVSLGEKDS